MYDIAAAVADVSRFSDPFTEPKIRVTPKHARVVLSRNGREMSFDIDSATGRIESKHRRAIFPDIGSLLVSEEMANLQQLAKTQLRAAKKDPRPIPIRMRLQGAPIDAKALTDYVAATCPDLRLLLIDGPAGIGKTYQIERLVVAQAQNVAKQKVSPPLLHVSSRGRRLSNLADVLASSTQQLGASFGAAQVPMLVRRGLLVVAIDGFDELVDAQGYEDSWSALRSFLSDVGPSGTVLLSARDTFVDEQELLEKIGEDSAGINLSIAHLRSPSPDDAIGWLSQAPSWKSADVDSDLTREFLSEGSYSLRPFFLKELQEAKGWREVLDVGLRTYLVNKMLHREAVLIAKTLGGVTAEAIKPKLVALLEEIALEMGAREIDWIERDHLAFMTMYSFEGLLDEEAQRKLAHKSGSFAFLEVGADHGRRSFPHSEIRNYFLGAAILSSLGSGVMPSVLRRAALSAEHMEVFFEVFESRPAEARTAISNLYQEFGRVATTDNFTTNLGALLIMGAGLGLVDRLDYLDVIDATFSGGSPELLINESRLGRLDARGSSLARLSLTGTRVDTLVIDGDTAFGAKLEGVENLEIRGSEGSEVIRGKERVLHYIDERVANSARDTGGNGHLDLLDKVVRRIARHHYLRERGGDDEGTFLLEDPRWPAIRSVLDAHGFLEVVKNKQMRGGRSNLIRVKRSRDFLERNDAAILRVLSEVAKLE